MSGLILRLFGAPRIERDGVPVPVERRRALALFAYLAVTRQPHARDALAALLWPELEAQRARAALRRTLVALNATIGKGWLVAEEDRVAFRSGPGLEVDVERFRDRLAQVAAHGHPPSRLCDICLAALTEAAGLYQGDFLAGFSLAGSIEFDDWQAYQAEELRRALAGFLERLAFAHAARREYGPAIGYARRWVGLDPLSEQAQRALMQAYAWSGDRAAALKQYDECVRVLADELGVEPEPETMALHTGLLQGRGDAGEALPAPAIAVLHNLPPDPTPFIGRDRELAGIAERLGEPACRLLTVLGPGGIGKTRLAIQAARDQVDRFEHGVYFVDLASLSAPELLADAILRTLPGAPVGGAEAEPRLLGYLAGKQILLVLDNVEQLQAGAGLLPRLLRAAPKLKLLVTSRARLNLREEWLLPLEGLDLAPEKSRTSSGLQEENRSVELVRPDLSLENYGATALFLSTLRRLLPDYRPSHRDAREIICICRLLEGLPLAIELAAAWARTVPLSEIARQVQHDLDLLATDLQDVPDRHRSMSAAFDHSWRLLSASERAILRRAAVFRGGFTAEAAQVVAGASLADLARLSGASWLRAGPDGRYGMHELIRQYCEQKLASEHAAETPGGEIPEQVRDRHAAYYQSLVVAQQTQFFHQEAAVSTVGREFENLAAAWEWCVARDDLEAIWTLTPGIGWVADRLVWDRAWMGLVDAALRQFTSAATLAGSNSSGALVAILLLQKAKGLREVGDLDRSEVCVRQVEALLPDSDEEDKRWAEARLWLWRQKAWNCQERGDFALSSALVQSFVAELREGRARVWPYADDTQLYWRGEACSALASSTTLLSHWDEARRWVEESTALYERSGSEIGKAHARRQRALWLICTGGYEEAETLARESLRMARTFGDRSATAESLYFLSFVSRLWGKPGRARPYCRRYLAFARDVDLPDHIAHALLNLAEAELALGNAAEARRLCRKCLARFEGQDLTRVWIAEPVMDTLGQAALATGDLPEAVRCTRLALRNTVCPVMNRARAIEAMGEVLLGMGQVERGIEALAFVAGWYGAALLTRRRAEQLLGEVEAEVPPDVFAAAVTHGRARQLEELVAALLG